MDIARKIKDISEVLTGGAVSSQELTISNAPWTAPESIEEQTFKSEPLYVVVKAMKHRATLLTDCPIKCIDICEVATTEEGIRVEVRFKPMDDLSLVNLINKKLPDDGYHFFFQPLFSKNIADADEKSIGVKLVFLQFTANEIHTIQHKISEKTENSSDVHIVLTVVADDSTHGDLDLLEEMPVTHDNKDIPNVMAISREKFNTEFCADFVAPRKNVNPVEDSRASKRSRAKTE